MTLVVKVFGVKECIEAFADLPRTIRSRHMRIGLNAAGGIIRTAAVANAPRGASGLLRKSLKVKVKVPEASYNQKHWGRPAYAVVGPSRNVAGIQTFHKTGGRGRIKALRVKRQNKVDTFTKSGMGVATNILRPARYAHLVEKGTKAHSITAKSASALASGGTVFGRTVRHPGTKGQRFLARSVASSGESAKQAMLRKLKDGIHEWAASRAARLATA